MNETCQDCGKPIHLASTICVCGEQHWCHDDVVDALFCPALSLIAPARAEV